jgi:hypothetical protein
MPRKIALVGQTDTNWRNEVWKKYDEKGEVYICYTHRITKHEALLKKQIDETPEKMFRFYFYHSKKGGGESQVVDVGYVRDFITGYSPSETPDISITPPGDVGAMRYKTWLHLRQITEITPPIDVLNPGTNPFRDFDTNAAFVPQQVKNSFAYVSDIGDSGDQPVHYEAVIEESPDAASDEGATSEDTLSIFLPESHIEELVASRPQIMGLGDLSLIGQQVKTPNGRLDLLFEDEDGQIIVVELKKGILSDHDIIQLKDYLNWASKKYHEKKVRGIWFCHSYNVRQQNSIEIDKAHGYNIDIKTYECLFTVK